MRESRFFRVGSVEQAPKADIQNNPLPAKPPTAVSQMTTIDHSREPNAFIAEPTAELPVIAEKEPGPQMRGADSVRSDPVVRNVVSQVVMAVQKVQADGFIELRLQPEELGRIRMTMLQTENGMMVQVAAEKPETLELFRRNIEQLEIDMKREGFSNLSFDFGQTQQNDHDGPDHTEPDDEPSNSTAEINTRITVHQMYRPITDGRVDIRI
jgi:flagellar hook-length control protein FliK